MKCSVGENKAKSATNLRFSISKGLARSTRNVTCLRERDVVAIVPDSHSHSLHDRAVGLLAGPGTVQIRYLALLRVLVPSPLLHRY